MPRLNGIVMAGLVPAIHALSYDEARTWMPGTSARSKASSSRPGMTVVELVDGAQNCSLWLLGPRLRGDDDGEWRGAKQSVAASPGHDGKLNQ